MKRKLSLLLSLMMVLTLIPAMPSFAATANRVDRVVSVTSSGETPTPAPQLIIGEDGKGDLQVGQTFRLELSEYAEWNLSSQILPAQGGTFTNATGTFTALAGDYSGAGAVTAIVNGVTITLDTDYTGNAAGAAADIVAQVDAITGLTAVAGAAGAYTITSDDENPIVIGAADVAFGLPANNTINLTVGVLSGALRLNRVSDRRIEVTVLAISDNAEFRIPLNVKFNGAPEGAQQVTVVPLNSGVTGNSYTFATIGTGEVTMKVDSKVKISRTGNQNVSIIIDEVAIDSFANNKDYTLRLPRNFTWGTIPTNTSLATFTTANSGRDLLIDVVGANNSVLESIFVNATIVPSRDANFGDVTVTVARGSISPGTLVVAEYVDFAGNVSVDKVLDVVSGRDEDGLYVAKVIVEEPVAGTLLNGRFVEFSLDKSVAALQNGEELKVTRKSGTSRLTIDAGSSQSLSNVVTSGGVAPDFTTATADITTAVGDARRDSHKWDLQVNAVGTASKFEVEIPFVVSAGFEGDVVLTVKGAGIEEQEVVIAKAVKPVKIEVQQNGSADVKIGLQRQSAPDIIITETEAGALAEDVTYFVRNRFADSGIIWRTATIEVIEGDLELNEDDTKRVDRGVEIKVESKSTRPSTIKISGVEVTLDRTVPFGPFEVDFNFGTVAANHDNLGNRVARLPYFNVVTPVQDTQRMTAVFTIGDANYTVNGEVMTLDAAPFIQNNRTMLPIGTIARVVGASVNYSAETRTAVFVKDGIVVSMTLDQPFLTANGVVIPMDSAPVVVNSRAFVPMAFVAQAFGVPVEYDAATRTVTVN